MRSAVGGIAFLPTFWILAAARASGKDAWLSRPAVGLFFLLSTLTLAFDLTAPAHHLFYRSVRLDRSRIQPVLVVDAGPWYWVHIGFSTLAFIIGTVLLAGAARHERKAYRRRAVLLLVGSAFPWAGMLVYELGLSPYGLDTTPLGLCAALPILAWAVFQYKVFDFSPVAKESVFASMREGAVILDTLGRIVDFNPAAVRIFPGLSDRSFGRTFEEATPNVPHLHKFLSSGERTELDLRLDADGAPRAFRAEVSTIMNRLKRHVGRILLLTEITEQVRLMENLRELATKDELTGAVNRPHFRELSRAELARAKRYGRALSVLIVDLDHFKKINDTWGHEAGDAVLRSVAGVFRSALRTSDILCRYGGEEFAVLLPETPTARAVGVAERLRAKLIENPIPIPGGAEVRVTASIGIEGADCIRDLDLEELLREADRAMYQAKAAGRNGIFAAAPKPGQSPPA